MAPDVVQCTARVGFCTNSVVVTAVVRGEIHPSCLTSVGIPFVVSRYARVRVRVHAHAGERGRVAMQRRA